MSTVSGSGRELTHFGRLRLRELGVSGPRSVTLPQTHARLPTERGGYYRSYYRNDETALRRIF